MNSSMYTKLFSLCFCMCFSGSSFSADTEAALDELPLDPEIVKDMQAVQNVGKEDRTGSNVSDAKTDVGDKSDVDDKSAVEKSAKPRDNEPAIAEIPAQREPAEFSAREQRFGEIKRSLQGPEGLLHLAKLETFVGEFPDHLQARLWLIRSQLLAQQQENALNSIGESEKWQDPDWQVSFWKAQVYLHHGQLGPARRAMEYALSNKSDSPEIWVQQAVLEQEAKNHSGAVQLLQIALEVDPANAIAHLNMGISLEHMSQHQAALRAYQKYLSSPNATNSTLRLKVLRKVESLARYIMEYKHDNSAAMLSLSSVAQGGDL